VVVNHGGDLFHKPSSLEQEEELGQLLTEPLTSRRLAEHSERIW
jgi:hypothetical protein